MIPLSSSFISKSLAQPPLRNGLTRLLAKLPQTTVAASRVMPSDTAIPFTLMSAFAIAISYADRSNLSTAIIPMAAAFHWDSFFSGLVLSSFWAGYALTQILGGKLADKYGGEKLLIFAMLVWSTCTALTPAAAGWGSVQVIAMRILLGAGEGLALPAIHSMIQKYVSPKDRSASTSVVTAACYFGALISNLLSPMIISHYGWQSCFLLFAAVPPLIWLPLWGLTFGKQSTEISSIDENKSDDLAKNILGSEKIETFSSSVVPLLEKMTSFGTEINPLGNSPSSSIGTSVEYSSLSSTQMTSVLERKNDNQFDQNKSDEFEVASKTSYQIDFIEDTESQLLINSVNSDSSKIAKEDYEDVLSIRTLLSARPVWAIIAAQYGQSWGMIGLLSWLPTYYSQRFGVPLESLSKFTVLPYFLQMIVGVCAGFAADKLISTGVRTLLVRNVLQVVGMIVPAICLASCAYLPSLLATQAAGLITFGSAISAITVAAVSVNHFDISPKNAGTIFGIGNTAGCIGGLIAVPGSGFLYDQTHNWNAVFLLFAFHYIGGALLWYIWSSDQPLKSSNSGI